MGSTFLQLTNKLLRRVNELELTSTTFSGARGVHALAKDAIINSVNYINQQDWQWPYNYVTTGAADFTLTVGQDLYSYPASAEDVDLDDVFISNTSTPDQQSRRIRPITHDEYKRILREGANNQTASTDYGLPRYVCKTPDSKLLFYPKPDAAYAVKVPFWLQPTEPTAHDSTITIPTRFDAVIISGAMWYLADMRNDLERAAANSETKFRKEIAAMKRLLIHNHNTDSFIGTSLYRPSRSSLKYLDT